MSVLWTGFYVASWDLSLDPHAFVASPSSDHSCCLFLATLLIPKPLAAHTLYSRHSLESCQFPGSP